MKVQMAEPFFITDHTLIKNTELYERTVLNVKCLLAMDKDSLLYNFRKNAGLDTKGAKPLTGWESPHMHFRGQFTGHYLTACARASLTLKKTDPELSAELRRRVERIVEGLGECQDELSKKEKHPGYLAAVEPEMLDDLENLHFTGVFTVVYYCIHKMMCGLLDSYTLLGCERALEILERLADYIRWRLSEIPEERIDRMINTKWYREDNKTFHMEFGGMAEVLLRLYRVTQKAEHLELAKKFDRKWFRNMLMGKRDVLGHYGLHANTEIPCVIGLAEYEDILHDGESGICVDTFMNWIRDGHMLPTGGVSGRPAYTAPADYGGELFEFPHMYFKHTNFKNGESCCSHNLNILARKEFQWTADYKWAADVEKRYVNAVLAQQHPQTGGFVYNLKVGQGCLKNHSTDGFFCCNATGMETYAYLTEGAFFHKKDVLWINHYVACDLEWKEQDVVIESRTDFPDEGNALWTFRMKEEKRLKICVRVPEWADENAVVKLNGNKMEKKEGGYIVIDRVWSNGDKIEAVFPYSLYIRRMEDRPEYISVFYGPHLLVACTGGYAEFDGTKEQLKESLVPTGKACEFMTRLSTGNVIFKPICRVVDEEYNGFTIVKKSVGFCVVDEVLIGNEASERSHALQESKSAAGCNEEGKFRSCEPAGYFSYQFTAVSGKKLWFRCYFQDKGTFVRRQEDALKFNQCFRFEVEKNGTEEEIAVQSLYEQNGEKLTAVYYPVMECEGKIRLKLEGSRYEGEVRGTGKFFNKIELGYFDD